tara:strand:- start:2519 stop:3115 length:597 start_codon:yes stop_codon:yes gene_type:complete
MIILTSEKLIIATPDGCDGSALHVELCDRRGAYWIPQVNSIGDYDDFGVEVPRQWKDFDRAVLVRNPYTRLLALREKYNKFRASKSDSTTGVYAPLSLGEYVDKVKMLQVPLINDWAAGLEAYTQIHHESIEKDIRKLTGLRIQCPVEHFGPWRKRFEKLSPEQLIFLFEYLIGDIVKFGYTTKAIGPIEAQALRNVF